MPKKTRQRDGWRGIAGFVYYRRRQDGSQLTVTLSESEPFDREPNGLWIVLALETPPRAGKDTVHDHILNNHAHKFLGKFPLTRAIAEAEAYAARWQPGQTTPCTCDDIAEPRRVGRAKRAATGRMSHRPRSSTRNLN